MSGKPPHLAWGEFLGWLELFEEENGPDGAEAAPLHIPLDMRRRMKVVFSHPKYAAILSETLQDIKRPIFYLGSPDEDNQGLLYEDAVDVGSSDEEGEGRESDQGDSSSSSHSSTDGSDSGVGGGEGVE